MTSAGSLVGQCVLESLRNRRANLFIVGTNTYLDHDNLRECDLAIPSPRTDEATFLPLIEQICREHQIDLVIPCRDEDILALSGKIEGNDSPIRLLSAKFDLIKSVRDKYDSYLKYGQTGINFAPTICSDDPEVSAKLPAFIEKWGFPLVSKPRVGNASIGVRVVTDFDQLRLALTRPGRVLQPFLNLPSPESLELDTSEGLPLFWEIPTNNFKAVSFFISRSGSASKFQCTSSILRLGRLEQMREDHDPTFQDYARRALETLHSIGWQGPVMIQAGIDKYGDWHAFELNPRFSGGTSARQILGFDEVKMTLDDWLGEDTVEPSHSPILKVVHRSLREWPNLR